MFSPKAHTDQADHNKDLLHQLLNHMQQFSDWIVTVSFYFAVHRVDAVLKGKFKQYPSSHKERNTLVRKYLPQISPDYEAIYSVSVRARYYPGYHIRNPLPKIMKFIQETEAIFSNLK
jgi:hypothetical protein